MSPELAGLSAGLPMGAAPPGSPAGPPAQPPAPEAAQGVALGFLEETAVDPDAATASVELAHLSRYRLRPLTGHTLGTKGDVYLGGRRGDRWDFGTKYEWAQGAGTAQGGYDLAPRVFGTSSLWAKVSCPVGNDGGAWAGLYAWKCFRVKRGRAGQARTTRGWVMVHLHHLAQIEDGTNSGGMGVAVHCGEMAEGGGTVGLFAGDWRPGVSCAEGLWGRGLYPPEYWPHGHPDFAPYAPGEEKVDFGTCRVEAGRIYYVIVVLQAFVLGHAPTEGGFPPLGGSIEFPRVLGLVVERIEVDSTRAG